MHPTALEGFRMMCEPDVLERLPRFVSVLDIGGADVNGTVHDVLRECYSVGWLDVLDIAPGPGVTIVADATEPETWDRIKVGHYDLIITTECFEHVPHWTRIVDGVASVLAPGGVFMGTAASIGRRPHGARGEHEPPAGEYYGNVDPGSLGFMLTSRFAGDVTVTYSRRPAFPTTHDVYWRAVR